MIVSEDVVNEVSSLSEKSCKLRHMLVNLVNEAGSSHIGGPLSACDVVTALFYRFMNFSKFGNVCEDPDRFVLSKGHNGDLLYCVFADMGLYTLGELMGEFKNTGGRWGEHPNRLHNPGFECSTGSLGHGLPIAAGMAMAAKMDGKKGRVFCLVGDGELQEGSNWESIMCAAQHSLGNIVLLVDKNGAQGTRLVSDICDDGNLGQRIASFGWDVREVSDGNDMIQVYEALEALPLPGASQKPICLVLHTVKGRGVDFMEADPANWHAGGFRGGRLEQAHKSIDAWCESECARLRR